MADVLAGALRERVGLETWVEARDDAGSDAGYWRAEQSVFAAVAPDTTTKAIEGETRRSTRRWRVTLRAPVAVSLTSRLIWQSRILSVLAIDDDPRQPERVVVRCEARAA